MHYRTFLALATLCGAAAQPALAQGGGTVRLLALQQQLRDDGCGVQRVTGRYDAATRRAVAQCRSKYNAPAGANWSAVLAAMNIGFGPNDTPPSLAVANEGRGEMGNAGNMAAPSRMRGRRGTSMRGGMMRDSMNMGRDRMNMGRDSMNMGRDRMNMGRDRMNMGRDSMNMRRGGMMMKRDSMNMRGGMMMMKRDSMNMRGGMMRDSMMRPDSTTKPDSMSRPIP